MKKYISFGTLLCVIPSLCLGYSARYTRLLQEKQRKIEELEKCTGSTGKLKIAGISTLGLTAAGVAGNVVEAQKIKEYGEESKKLDKKIAAQQETKTQLEEDIRKQEQAKKEKDEDCFNDINNKVTWVNYKIYVDLPKADDKYELSEVEAKSISDKWVYDERLDLDTITYDDPCKVLKNLDNFIKQKDKCKTLLTSAKVDNGKVVATYVYTNPDECGDGTDETINTIADNETPESVCNNLFESSDKTDYATKNCAYVLPSDNNSVEYLCAQKYSGRRCSKKRLDCYKQKGATEWKNGDELDGICTCTDTSKVWDENQAKCVSKIAGGNSAATASNAGSGNSSSSSNTSNGSNNSSSSSSASSNSNSSSSSSASSSGNNTTTTSNSSSRDSSSLKSKNKKVVAKIASNQRGTSGAYKKTTGECYNPNFSPTALLCDDLSKGGWKVVFDSGVVYGKSMCSTTSGNKNGETTTIDESGEGSNCWCNVGGSWVFNINYGLPGNCDNCPYACSYDVFYIGTYRDVLFGTLLN